MLNRSNMVAFTHRKAKNPTFLKLWLPISASIEHRWLCMFVYTVCVCECFAEGTWLLEVTLGAVWTVWDDFWKRVFGKKKSDFECRGSPVVSAMARSLLTDTKRRSWVLTVNQGGEMDGRSSPYTQLLITIQWLCRLMTSFMPAQALLMPGPAHAEDRLLFYLDGLQRAWLSWQSGLMHPSRRICWYLLHTNTTRGRIPAIQTTTGWQPLL